MSSGIDGFAALRHAVAGVKDEALRDDSLSVVCAALIAHPLGNVAGKQPPFVTYALTLCSLHEELMLLLCPVPGCLQQ